LPYKVNADFSLGDAHTLGDIVPQTEVLEAGSVVWRSFGGPQRLSEFLQFGMTGGSSFR
jgi:hypothetical protein